MIGTRLPITLSSNQILDYKVNEGKLTLDNKPLKYQLPIDEKSVHLTNWFIEDRLPELEQCNFYQCQFTKETLTLLKEDYLYLLVGYAEKYRKYIYPLVIDPVNLDYWMTSQPIYYNYNQKVSIDCLNDHSKWSLGNIPMLKIQSFGHQQQYGYHNHQHHRSETKINLIRCFTLNPSPAVYAALV